MPCLARPYRLIRFPAVCALLASFAMATGLAPAQIVVDGQAMRTLSGVVTSTSHEPLKGAVVELQHGDGTTNIVTYITGADGRYEFKRLDSQDDYRVWVIFRKRHSKTYQISKFDDHRNKVIDFSVETF